MLDYCNENLRKIEDGLDPSELAEINKYLDVGLHHKHIIEECKSTVGSMNQSKKIEKPAKEYNAIFTSKVHKDVINYVITYFKQTVKPKIREYINIIKERRKKKLNEAEATQRELSSSEDPIRRDVEIEKLKEQNKKIKNYVKQNKKLETMLNKIK